MSDKIQNDVKRTDPWYQAAYGTAVVGGVFCIVIAGLLFVNYLQIKVFDPVRAEKLEIMKLKVADQPDNDQLLSQIRETDLQIRHDTFRRLDYSRKGAYLLLAGFVVFLAGAKIASVLAHKPPSPVPSGDVQAQQVRQATLAGRAVMFALVLLGIAAVVLSVIGGPDLVTSEGKGGGADTNSVAIVYPSIEEVSANWPSFRGPGGSGISKYTNIPLVFDPNSGGTVVWQNPVALAGHSSPVVWKDKVFISGADEKNLNIFCFDAFSGKQLWTGVVPLTVTAGAEPVEFDDETGFAASTMVTDGQRAYAIFATGDMGCFDFEGKRVWTKNLGTPDSTYGYASSLAMWQNKVIVQYDQASVEEGKSKLYALDGATGQIVWDANRPVPNTWTSPIVTDTPKGFRIFTSGDPWVIAYDPNDGKELWRLDCLGTDVAPSPIFAGGFVFAVEPNTEVLAIRPGGKGDVTETHIAWTAEDGIPDITSPVSDGEHLWLLSSDGVLTCYKVADGTKVYEHEIDMVFQSSPSLVGDKLYLLAEKGVLVVVQAGAEFKQISRSTIGQRCLATPAFADGRMYIRTEKTLYCIGSKN